MKNRKWSLLALLLAVVMLLGGCVSPVDPEILARNSDMVSYAEMEYERPNMVALEQVLEESCRVAREEKDIARVEEAIYAFYDEYDRFYTCLSLAYIRYCGDMTDTYWQEEYNYCAAQTGTVDAGLDTLYRALAQSPIRKKLETDAYFGQGFFDTYEGESVWDAQFLDYLDQETALIDRYYDLSTQALEVEAYSQAYYDTYAPQMAQVLVELVALRQEIATYVGYDSYPEFANDFYYYRDYTPDQVEAYAAEIQRELVPLYRQMSSSDLWYVGAESCHPQESFRFLQTAAEKMDGLIEGAFQMLRDARLYDIEYGENKYAGAYSVYLEYYYEPFIFMNPTMTREDQLTLVHEFGHFAHDYVCWGTYASTDVAEVLSQGMEYMALCYGGDTTNLTQYKMLDCLSVYVEQVAFALFEQRIYDLRGEELTAENIQTLYESIGRDFGFDVWQWDAREYVTITHFFTDPMYVISYVVSNDAAFQLYQRELAEEGTGLALYKDCLYAENTYFLEFVEEMGLESPFAEGRVARIRQTLEEILK